MHPLNEQNVIVENKATEKVVTPLNQVTMLIDYFSLNLLDEEVRQYLYVEIPRYILRTFKREKINETNVLHWIKRKSHYNCIRRMYSVSPAQNCFIYNYYHSL